MHRHRAWTWLHRIGYVTTAIVAVELTVIACVSAVEWKNRYDRRQETRMQAGPATSRLRHLPFHESLDRSLTSLPSLQHLQPDGLRFIAHPSFGDTNFAVALRRTAAGGEGVLRMTPANGSTAPPLTRSIRLSAGTYQRLASQIDDLAASWNGTDRWWTDGTSVVLERVKGPEVTSGFGNTPRFHGKVAAIVFRFLEPTTPELGRFDETWHRRELESR